MTKDQVCADCAGFDLEWMHYCVKHKAWFCRGCACPDCVEDSWEYYEEDGPQDLETTLESELERGSQRRD